MLLDVLNWAGIGFLALCAICAVGLVAPFRPFGNRRRAAWSLIVVAGALLATNISLAAVAPPAPQRGADAGLAHAAEPAEDPAPEGPMAGIAATAAELTAPAVRATGDALRAVTRLVPSPPEARDAVLQAVRLTPPATPAPDPAPTLRFPEGAFSWTGDTDPYRAQIVDLVNRIARQHGACRDPDPKSLRRTAGGAAGDPQFQITCGRGHDAFRIRFRPGDAAGGRVFSRVPPMEADEALAACEAAARARAAEPESVRFTEAPDLTYVNRHSGEARIQARFRGRMTGAGEQGYAIDCLFEGRRLIEARVEAQAG
jgi:hypothetical protein